MTDVSIVLLKPDGEYLKELQTACDWVGIDHGRAIDYKRIYEEFIQGERGREHILGYNESCEVTEIFDLWEKRVDDYPGLREKIKAAFVKGTVLREQEKAGKSNRPRNDAFVYFLAGRLLASGVSVLGVDSIPARGATLSTNADIIITVNAKEVDIECKRPMIEGALESRVRQAEGQFLRRPGHVGIIAADCSAFIRPGEKLLASISEPSAGKFVMDILTDRTEPIRDRIYDERLLGFILYARVPAMIHVETSRILNRSGQPHLYYRRQSVGGFVFARHHRAAEQTLFATVHTKFAEHIESVKKRKVAV